MNRKTIETALRSEQLDRAWNAALSAFREACEYEKMEALRWVRERRLAVFWAMEGMSGSSLSEVYELTYAQLCGQQRLLEAQTGVRGESTLKAMLLALLIEAMEEPMEFSTVNRIQSGFTSCRRAVIEAQTELPLAA